MRKAEHVQLEREVYDQESCQYKKPETRSTSTDKGGRKQREPWTPEQKSQPSQ
jgi:hypothetical protein